MIKTYKHLKGKTWDQPGVPKWIFRAGNDSLENLHPEIAQIYNTQLENNPDYELFYFSREDRLQFITDQNNDQLLSAYNKIIPEAFKTDIFRYVVLTTYGGVWMDFSMQSLVSLADIVKNYDYVYVKDTAGDYNSMQGIYNAFIVSQKDNSFLKIAIEKCIYNITNELYCDTDLSVTSPHLLGSLYREVNDVENVPVGVTQNNTVFYEHRITNQFIDDNGVNIIQIKHPNHYQILYNTQEKYGVIWNKGQLYNSSTVIKGFKDIKDRKWEGEGIPKWIFKTGSYKLENLPELYKHIFLDILKKNPGYELFYFSDEDCMLSIHHHYGEEYFRLHQKLIPTAYQADFWRYCILNQYGGCYGDFSQIPLVSYDELTEGFDRVFARDDPSPRNFLYNAVMCVKAGDAVVAKAIEISVNNIRNSNYDGHPLGIVGPKVLGQAFITKGFNINSSKSYIHVGKYKGSNILKHLQQGGIVQDDLEKNIFVTKIGNHYGVLYDKRKHYGELWHSRQVFR
jgi:mannosyltransferase OCH1-like enzyme